MFAFLGHRHHANGASAIPNPTAHPIREEVIAAQANDASVSSPPDSALQQMMSCMCQDLTRGC